MHNLFAGEWVSVITILTKFSVGRDISDALVLWVVVGGVGCPRTLVIVDVHHHQAVAGQSGVKSLFLTVFQYVEFVSVSIVVKDVGLWLFCQRLHVLHLCCRSDFHGFKPSRHPALVGGVSRGDVAVYIVASAAHDVPCSHASSARVRCVVSVGQAQAVAEFMTGGADSCKGCSLCAHQLAGAGIAVQFHVVKLHTLGQIKGMGPDGVWLGTIVLAKSGIDKEYLVHLAVVVPVIVGIVHIGISQTASFFRHFLWCGIVSRLVVSTVIAHVFTQFVGSHHIEVHVQLTIALRPEIICHRTAHAVVGISI